ncbi:hypothetical protein [Lysinibacillus xylanilyticus]|uniref:hypothetical protein n=1 Tax=Lysinibacillus xylanilyticus TaxID=582475 RepID=UPI003D094257
MANHLEETEIKMFKSRLNAIKEIQDNAMGMEVGQFGGAYAFAIKNIPGPSYNVVKGDSFSSENTIDKILSFYRAREIQARFDLAPQYANATSLQQLHNACLYQSDFHATLYCELNEEMVGKTKDSFIKIRQIDEAEFDCYGNIYVEVFLIPYFRRKIMFKKFMSFTIFTCCLFLFGCTDTDSNQKNEFVTNQKKVEIFNDEHLVIEENIEEKIGFKPDKAMAFDAKDSYEQNVIIDGEEAIYYKIPTTTEYFDFNYKIDTLKKNKEDKPTRNFRIFVYENKEFVDFWVNNKSQKYYDVKIPNNSSINIPISVKMDLQKDYSDILVVLIDLNIKNNIHELMNASKILVSRKDIKNNIKDYTKKDLDNDNLKLRSEKNNSDEMRGVNLLNKNVNNVDHISEAKFIKLNQVPAEVIQEVMVFDIDGEIHPFSGGQSEAITLKRKDNEDIIIPYNKNKTDKRLFILMNNNPNQLAFKHLNDLKDHKVEQYQNYSDIFEIGN